jgi:hypothetical protein
LAAFFFIGFLADFSFAMGAAMLEVLAIGAEADMAAGVAANAPIEKAEAMTAMRVFMEYFLGERVRADCSASQRGLAPGG